MPYQLKATNTQLTDAYEQAGSIYAVANRFSMAPGTVHERLQKLGVKMEGNGRAWTPADDAMILASYAEARRNGQVKSLAKKMRRAYTALAMRAHTLGVSKSSYTKDYSRKIKTEADARTLFDEFKSTSELLWQFCKRKKISDDTFHEHVRDRWPDEWDAVIESKAPIQSFYRIGRAFEYRVRDAFAESGYFVLRSPRSGSPTDLVAVKKGMVVFIQCKRSGQIASKEWNILFDLAQSSGSIPVLACMKDRKGIELWKMTGRKDGSKTAQPRTQFFP